MSEIAEMVIDGLLCEKCGDLIDGDSPGFPRNCATCGDDKVSFETPSWMSKVINENAEQVAYVQMRVKSDKTITTYFEERDGNLSQIDDFVAYVVAFRLSLLDEDSDVDIDIYTTEEVAYIVQKTGCSTDIVELILWYEECYLMSLGNVTLVEICKKCRHDELLFKEDEETLFATYLECEQCGESYDHDDFF